MTGQLIFEHAAPVWQLALSLLAAMLVSVWLMTRRFTDAAARRILLPLRLIFLALLAWCFFQPTRKSVITEQIKPRFAVVLDTSASMDLRPDPDKPFVTRRQAAHTALDGAWRTRLNEHFQIDYYTFDETAAGPRPFAQLTEARSTGKGTHLREALREIVDQYRARPPAGILLLSDGLDTREARDDWASRPWPCPIYTVRLEAPDAWESEPDAQVETVTTQRRVTRGWESRLTAVISARGPGSGPVPVQLLRDQTVVDEKTVELPTGGGRREVAFALKHPKTGSFDYTVYVPPLSRESRTNDNRQTVSVQVVEVRNRLLYVEGTPRWESKYLVRALQANTMVSAQSYLRGPGGTLIHIGEGEGSQELALTEAQLRLRRIVIIGDFSAADLGQPAADALVQFVANGGSLLLLGGPAAWGPDGFVASPLKALLPVDRPWDAPAVEGRFETALTRDGRTHAAFTRGAQAWTKLPPVLSLFSGAKPRPGASVILEARTDQGGQPLVAGQTYGQGKVTAILTDTLWRWQLTPGADEPYLRFWNQLIEWMAPAETLPPHELELSTDADEVRAGEPVRFQARVTSREPWPGGELPVVQGEIQTPDKRRLPMEMKGRPETATSERGGFSGVYTAEFTLTEPGRYRATARVEINGSRLETEPCSVTVKPYVMETTVGPMAVVTLETLATRSGGYFCALDELDARLTQIRAETIVEEHAEFSTRWHYAWVLAALIALLTAEWTLRKLRSWP